MEKADTEAIYHSNEKATLTLINSYKSPLLAAMANTCSYTHCYSLCVYAAARADPFFAYRCHSVIHNIEVSCIVDFKDCSCGT